MKEKIKNNPRHYFLGFALLVFLNLSLFPLAAQTVDNPYEGYLTINYYLHLDQPEKAQEQIDLFLEKYPQDPFILTEKAYLLQNLKNDSQTATQLLEKAIALYPEYYYANYLLASLLYSSDQEDKDNIQRAVKLLETSLQDNVDFYDSLYLLGIIKSEQGEYAVSNGYLEQANRLEQHVSTYYYMATNYQKLKDKPAEIATYEKILTLSPANNKALHALAQIYMESAHYQKASLYLEKLYHTNPNARQILLEYLYSLFAAGEDQKFLEIAKSVDLTDSSILLYAKALILFRQQQFDHALTLLETQPQKDLKNILLITEIHSQKQDFFQAYLALEKVQRPDWNVFYYSQKIQLFSLLGLNRRLLELFNEIYLNKEITENLPDSDYYSILYACASLNDLDKAKEVVRFMQGTLTLKSDLFDDLVRRLEVFSPSRDIIIQGDPQKIATNLFLLLKFYRQQPEVGAAISLLTQIIEKSSVPNPFAHLQLCEIYLQQQQLDKVESYLLTLKTQFPDSLSITNFLAYFWGQQNKNLQEALALSATTLTAEPENYAFLDTYGCILLKLNRLPEAQTYLEKAHQKNPFDPDILEHLANCYHRQEKEARIIQIYQNAINMGVDFKEQLLEKIKPLQTQKEK